MHKVKIIGRCLSHTPLSRLSVSLLRGNHGDSFSQSGFLNQFLVYITGCSTPGANILPALRMHPWLSPTSSTSFWLPNPAYPATSVQVIFSRKNFLAIPAVTHLSSSWQQYYSVTYLNILSYPFIRCLFLIAWWGPPSLPQPAWRLIVYPQRLLLLPTSWGLPDPLSWVSDISPVEARLLHSCPYGDVQNGILAFWP